MLVHTIGHSNHSLARFVELLRQNGIAALVDVRRYPQSRRLPHFNQQSLADGLAAHGIAYHWLEALGGRRSQSNVNPSPNLGIEDESFRNYADYMLCEAFQAGVRQLLALAETGATAIMCSEGQFTHCHRKLVSDFLCSTGAEVRHILPSGEPTAHVLPPGANVTSWRVTYPGQQMLF